MFALGHLVSMRLKHHVSIAFREQENLLVWDGDNKELLIVDPVNRKREDIRNDEYEQFHAKSPTSTMQVDWFKPNYRNCKMMGLISVINYYIPKHFNSEKRNKEYSHKFGDFGDGKVERSIQLLPILFHDRKRDRYYIYRRPENKWIVDDYIRG